MVIRWHYIYMILASLFFGVATDNIVVSIGCVFTFLFFMPLISKLMEGE